MAWPGRTGTPVLLVGTRLDDLAAMAASSFLGVCVEVREARGGVEPPRPLRDRLFSGQRPAPSLGWPRLRCQGRARTCGASGQNRGWDAVAHLAWGVWRGSNPLPPGSRPGASIASASDTERTAGLEPATSTMARWRTDLLRYVRETLRTLGRNRTRTLLVRSQASSPLDHEGKTHLDIAVQFSRCR